MTENINKINVKKSGGFTLPEVIVSIGIIVTVIVSAMGILVTVIRTNAENLNTLTAYGLAQEGIEASRFMRDSNFLLGLNFNGSKPNDGINLWLGNSILSDKYVLVKNTSIIDDCNKINLEECLPYRMEVADENNVKIKKNEDGVYLQGSNVNGNETQFERVLYLKPDSDQTDGVSEYQIVSEVNWLGQNVEEKSSVVLTTTFTDWQFKSSTQNQ